MRDGRHWLVYTHGGGRLGNQMLRWAHWLAWAKDYPDDVGVVNPVFWPYAPFFEGTFRHPGCVFPGSSAVADALATGRAHVPSWVLHRAEWRTQHLVHALGLCVPGIQRIGKRVKHDEHIDLDGDAFFQRVSSHRVTTCAGWRIAGWDRLRKRQEELRAYFQPAGEQAMRAEDFIAKQRARFGRLVGVLIRQGDYMIWRDGRFGYPAEDYAAWMREVLKLEGGDGVGFVITSDTKQDPALFAGLPHVFSSGSANEGGPAIASFAELAGCDIVLGPPSTFAAMAAFVGNRPLWPLYARGQVLSRGQILHDALLDATVDPIYSEVVK